jgi:hypothetical protein
MCILDYQNITKDDLELYWKFYIPKLNLTFSEKLLLHYCLKFNIIDYEIYKLHFS